MSNTTRSNKSATEQSGRTFTLNDYLVQDGRIKTDEFNRKDEIWKTASPRPASDADSGGPDSSDAMIKAWKNELRLEKEEELEVIFAVIDKLAAKNASQMCAVQDTVDSFMEEESDDEDDSDGDEVDEEDDRNYENVEIPDQALSEYIDHADLTDEESEILNDNTTKMYSWIIYQLCQEIVLGE